MNTNTTQTAETYPINENCPFYDAKYCPYWGCDDCNLEGNLAEVFGVDELNEYMQEMANEYGIEFTPYENKPPEGVPEDVYLRSIQEAKEAQESDKKLRKVLKIASIVMYILFFITIICFTCIPLILGS